MTSWSSVKNLEPMLISTHRMVAYGRRALRWCLPSTLTSAADRAGAGLPRFPWNALLCGGRFAVPEVTPVAGHGAEGDRHGTLTRTIRMPSGSSIHIRSQGLRTLDIGQKIMQGRGGA